MKGKFLKEYFPEREFEFQEKLFSALVIKNFEMDGKYIISTKNFIPITLLVLLTKDALDRILSEIEFFHKQSSSSNIPIDHRELEKIGVTKSKSENSIERFCKEVKIDFDKSQSVSGTFTVKKVNIYSVDDDNISLNDLFVSENPNIEITEKSIKHNELSYNEKFNIIKLYQQVFLCSDLFYAIDQRLKEECKLYKKYFPISVNIPFNPQPNNVGIICAQRGEFIHGKGISISFDEHSDILLGSKEIKKTFSQAFEECLEWIDNVYEIMYTNLN